MATSNLNYLEESRPPDDSSEDLHNSNFEKEVVEPLREHPMRASSRPPDELPLAVQNLNAEISTQNMNFNNNNGDRHMDINSNRVDSADQCDILTVSNTAARFNNTHKKFQERSTEKRRPLSAPERKRNSYHLDVEEALSSLLWQPYEYQRNISESSDSLNSIISSSSSSITTSEDGNLTTMQWLNKYGNNADPNLSLQMVSNLIGINGIGVGEEMNQWKPLNGIPRDMNGRAKVSSELTRLSLSRAASELSATRQPECYLKNNVSLNKCISDYCGVLSDDTRVEISGANYNHDNKPDDDNSRVTSDLLPSKMTSMVNANVVGLPITHSRSSSNISTHRAQQENVIQHPRSASEVLVFRSATNLAQNQPLRPKVTQQQPSLEHPKLKNSSEVQVLGANFHSSTNIVHSRQHSGNLRGVSEPPQNVTPVITISESRSVQNVPQSPNSEENNRVPPLPNVSNVNVNFYRAVPVNVVSSVPTISCLNSVSEGNDVSNVHIVQAMPQTIPSVSITTSQVTIKPLDNRTRTFTSTEAQTDDTTVGNLPSIPQTQTTREQRRRERRERRHQRRLNQTNHQHVATQQCNNNERLPDLLNSHLPPPYTTLPQPAQIQVNTVAAVGTPVALPHPPPPPTGILPYQVPLVGPVGPGPNPIQAGPQTHGFRFSFPTAAGFRRCRSRLGGGSGRYATEEDGPKGCCGVLVSRPGGLRWFIALIALVAVCCVLVGTVLGAMRPAGRDHLTVSLLMIGVGIVLVTVSGVAWRLTSHDSPSCRAMLGLDSGETGADGSCPRRFVPRLPPSYGRPHHPYAAMIYPEFQYRPPPPSYQASMQEYRLRLLLLDRGQQGAAAQGTAQAVVSPPPTYRSHAGSLLRAPLSSRRDATQSEYSCPPSYRSRSSSNRPGEPETIIHSREQSLTLSESNHESVVNVVNILTNQTEEIALDNLALDSLKVLPDGDSPLRMLLKGSQTDLVENSTTKEGNLVTIVQKEDQNPVIVTVSGSQMSTAQTADVGSSTQIPSEMEILAHL